MPVERCHAAVPRPVKDYRPEEGTEELTDWLKKHPFELVTDQCRRAASAVADTYPVCATHARNHDGGFIYPAIPFVGRGHWEWVSDE